MAEVDTVWLVAHKSAEDVVMEKVDDSSLREADNGWQDRVRAHARAHSLPQPFQLGDKSSPSQCDSESSDSEAPHCLVSGGAAHRGPGPYLAD
jgi:hypothetical protein